MACTSHAEKHIKVQFVSVNTKVGGLCYYYNDTENISTANLYLDVKKCQLTLVTISTS